MTAVITTDPTSATTDWAPFRVLLETQRADCVDQRALALAETVTSVPDAVALGRAGTLLRTIQEIDAALDRIDAGTYGGCLRCGAAIPEERLESRPFAPHCVTCQQPR